MKKEAMFGAGCFWHVEETLRKLKGVLMTEVGFAGGEKDNPSYEEVCWDETGHAEVVHLEYDDDEISYSELLDVFWGAHDPTQINRQGPDVGSQYRSVIFYYGDEQKKIAEKSIEEHQKELPRKIVTQIVKASNFFKAEEYHQKYLMKRGRNTC